MNVLPIIWLESNVGRLPPFSKMCSMADRIRFLLSSVPSFSMASGSLSPSWLVCSLGSSLIPGSGSSSSSSTVSTVGSCDFVVVSRTSGATTAGISLPLISMDAFGSAGFIMGALLFARTFWKMPGLVAVRTTDRCMILRDSVRILNVIECPTVSEIPTNLPRHSFGSAGNFPSNSW